MRVKIIVHRSFFSFPVQIELRSSCTATMSDNLTDHKQPCASSNADDSSMCKEAELILDGIGNADDLRLQSVAGAKQRLAGWEINLAHQIKKEIAYEISLGQTSASVTLTVSSDHGIEVCDRIISRMLIRLHEKGIKAVVERQASDYRAICMSW